MLHDAPIVLSTKDSLRAFVADVRGQGQTIGFVPTMGALHDGHLSLVRAARASCDVVIVSIFVNPTQFAQGEDFDVYPRTLDGDCALLTTEKVGAVFAPSPVEMYGRDFSANLCDGTTVLPGAIAKRWEGEHRPTHFAGVALVVTKLLNLVVPDKAFFGEKDYQQLRVVTGLVHDLDIPVEIIGCPTVREPDGLALSSRNRYLNPSQRITATMLYSGMQLAQELCQSGERNVKKIESAVREYILGVKAEDIRVGYVALVDEITLEPIESIGSAARMLVSVWVGDTHLIDNERIIAREVAVIEENVSISIDSSR